MARASVPGHRHNDPRFDDSVGKGKVPSRSRCRTGLLLEPNLVKIGGVVVPMWLTSKVCVDVAPTTEEHSRECRKSFPERYRGNPQHGYHEGNPTRHATLDTLVLVTMRVRCRLLREGDCGEDIRLGTKSCRPVLSAVRPDTDVQEHHRRWNSPPTTTPDCRASIPAVVESGSVDCHGVGSERRRPALQWPVRKSRWKAPDSVPASDNQLDDCDSGWLSSRLAEQPQRR